MSLRQWFRRRQQQQILREAGLLPSAESKAQQDKIKAQQDKIVAVYPNTRIRDRYNTYTNSEALSILLPIAQMILTPKEVKDQPKQALFSFLVNFKDTQKKDEVMKLLQHNSVRQIMMDYVNDNKSCQQALVDHPNSFFHKWMNTPHKEGILSRENKNASVERFHKILPLEASPQRFGAVVITEPETPVEEIKDKRSELKQVELETSAEEKRKQIRGQSEIQMEEKKKEPTQKSSLSPVEEKKEEVKQAQPKSSAGEMKSEPKPAQPETPVIEKKSQLLAESQVQLSQTSPPSNFGHRERVIPYDNNAIVKSLNSNLQQSARAWENKEGSNIITNGTHEFENQHHKIVGKKVDKELFKAMFIAHFSKQEGPPFIATSQKNISILKEAYAELKTDLQGSKKNSALLQKMEREPYYQVKDSPQLEQSRRLSSKG